MTISHFLQSILPKLRELREFVSHPPSGNLRLHCTMIRQEEESNQSPGTVYTLYVEYLGGLVPILKVLDKQLSDNFGTIPEVTSGLFYCRGNARPKSGQNSLFLILKQFHFPKVSKRKDYYHYSRKLRVFKPVLIGVICPRETHSSPFSSYLQTLKILTNDEKWVEILEKVKQPIKVGFLSTLDSL